jgi:chemotaxis signal transduction protein
MIGGRRLAVEVVNIIEIINPASEKYSDAGIAADEKSLSYQGKSLPLIRLADLIPEEVRRGGGSSRILISEYEGKEAALVVDSVEEIIRLSEEDMMSVESPQSGLSPDALAGTFRVDDREIGVISLGKILRQSRVI